MKEMLGEMALSTYNLYAQEADEQAVAIVVEEEKKQEEEEEELRGMLALL